MYAPPFIFRRRPPPAARRPHQWRRSRGVFPFLSEAVAPGTNSICLWRVIQMWSALLLVLYFIICCEEHVKMIWWRRQIRLRIRSDGCASKGAKFNHVALSIRTPSLHPSQTIFHPSLQRKKTPDFAQSAPLFSFCMFFHVPKAMQTFFVASDERNYCLKDISKNQVEI